MCYSLWLWNFFCVWEQKVFHSDIKCFEEVHTKTVWTCTSKCIPLLYLAKKLCFRSSCNFSSICVSQGCCYSACYHQIVVGPDSFIAIIAYFPVLGNSNSILFDRQPWIVRLTHSKCSEYFTLITRSTYIQIIWSSLISSHFFFCTFYETNLNIFSFFLIRGRK